MAGTTTPRQRVVLAYIAKISREHGYAPSTRDICNGLGMRSTIAAADHVAALCRQALVTKVAVVARSLRVTEAGYQALDE
jgi:repressor LexA